MSSLLSTPEFLRLAEKVLPILSAQTSLHEFVKQAWHIIEPKEAFIDGMHIQAVCKHLEAISRGHINQDIIINLPPRLSKSTIACVMWPAWDWIENPWRRWIFASHSIGLSKRDSIRCKDVIKSKWYQNNWGHLFHLIKDTEVFFENNHKGFRNSVSADSRVTGEGADIIVADDLNDTKEVFSDTIRASTNLFFSSTLSMRLNNPKSGRIVLMAQRSHELDVSGFLIQKDKSNKVIKLILPMEYETNRKCKTVPLSPGEKAWEDPRTKPGELLWPERIGPEELDILKFKLSTAYARAGQLQQRPSPEEGGIIKKNFFSWWKKPKPPKTKLIIQSWDFALSKEDLKKNSWSACTTWGVFDDFGEDEDQITGVPNLILLDCCRFRLGYVELRKRVKRLTQDYRDKGDNYVEPDGHHVPDYILIEDKAAGRPMASDLGSAGIYAILFDPSPYGDKVNRVQLFTHIMESGKVWLPANPFTNYKSLYPAVEEFQEECLLFPNAEHDDWVDTLSQVMLKLISSGYLYNSNDPRRIKQIKSKKKKLYGPDMD